MPATDPPATDPLRRALAAVQDMRTRLEAAESREHEPVAIVGMACRFPGGDDVESWWTTLRNGVDAVTEVPRSRWNVDDYYDPDPDAPGKMSTRWGGFVRDADAFDAAFFGISPREALGIDPQQRLLLEAAWHALEDAGIAPDSLAGTRTGVYVGISTNDYARILSGEAGATWVDAHASTGNSVAVAAGRLSYTLGLQGPSLAIDTACSSSLVAVHQAVRALRSGEVSLSLAAGVNLTLLPELTIGFSKARMMAADGRCKTFDAAADGYVRGEGCGVVVLKRLSDAIAAGDLIHAIVRGSAVNHDGRSAGLTAPNGPAQVAVIRAALADARIDAADVSLIEAHGTGTSLGDPIEARALGEVFGGRPREAPAPWLASVKTQVGHLEAAAGMAGLIKAALCLRERTVTPHLHFRTLNPHIAADGFDFRIPTSTQAWEPVSGRWVAGVSSFGFSGTNAHVILEAAPPAAERKGTRTPFVMPLSARDTESLDSLRQQVGHALQAPGTSAEGLANTLASGRAHQPWRMAVVANDASSAAKALADAKPGHATEPPPLAFLFTGQGCQYAGMAAGLLAEPRFRDTLAHCDTVLAPKLGKPLAALLAPDAAADLARTDRLQPVLFAIEYAVADLWRSWGVTPAAVLGHSLGEIAAACFAGALPLEDALAFVAERGRLMHACAGGGSMAAVLKPASDVRSAIEGTGAVIAADNAPSACVIAGPDAALERALATLDTLGAATQRLEVATAFHSAALDDCLDALQSAAAAMRASEALVPVASNLTGALAHTFDAAYWRRQAREAVRCREGFVALAAKGIRHFVEVGPHPVLSGFGRAMLPEATFVASLRRGADAQRTLAEALAQLYTLGAPVDWRARQRSDEPRSRAPGTPFRRDRFWPAATGASHATPATGLAPSRIDSPLPQHLYETSLSLAGQPFLGDHIVFGKVVVPGALHAVAALAVLVAEGRAPVLEDLVFEQALELPEAGTRLQAILDPEGGLALSARGVDGQWVRHAVVQAGEASAPTPEAIDLDSLRARCTLDDAGPGALFTQLAERGIDLGPAFRGTQALWRGDGEALADIQVPASLRQEARGVAIHPATLDACFQSLGATFRGAGAEGGFLPLSIDRLRVLGPTPDRFFCHARAGDGAADGKVAIGHFRLCDAQGRVFLVIEGLQVKRVEAPRPAIEEALLAMTWARAAVTPLNWGAPAELAAAARNARPADDSPAESPLAAGLESLADAFAHEALETLGSAKVAASKERLASRLRQMAALHRASGNAGADTLERALRAAHPSNAREIDLVSRCGRGLAGVLRGEDDPLQLLFPQGDSDESGLYGGAGLAATSNTMMAAAVSAAVGRRDGRALRVIEVGAGTGATTAALLPALAAAKGSTYRFTDVSAAFLPAAVARFGEAIETSVLDIESPSAVGALAGQYDVVVAANVVHATTDVVASLSHLRRLLAPGGVLLLLESTRAQRWWDIVFGLTPGWWRFTDTGLRPDHPLLDAPGWQRALGAAGFGAVAQAPADEAGRLSVIVATAPPPSLFVVGAGDDTLAAPLARSLCEAWEKQGAPAKATDVQSALGELATLGEAPASVVYLGGLRAAPASIPEARQALRDAFDLTRAMATAGREGLVLVTRGARGPAPVTDPSAAMLWGLADVAALEHPELRLRRVDLDPTLPPDAGQLVAELQRHDEERVAWRGGERHAARLAPAGLPADLADITLQGGTCLVTGAFGGLGPRLAEWLAQRGAGALVLTGRRLPSDALASQLNALPTRVSLHALDITDASALTALLARVRRELPPIEAVLHLAGSVSDGALLNQDWARFAAVLDAKADGARLLDRHVTDSTLRHFVLFSTSASLIGNRGQANHAAANAFLDALAHERQSRGLPGLSINWGAWAEAGAVASGDYASAMAERGVRAFSPAEGFVALGRAMASGLAQVGVVSLDWPRFLVGYGSAIPSFFAHFAPRAQASPRAQAGNVRPARPAADLRALLAACAPEAQEARLEAFLREEAAAVLGMADASRIDPEQALSELGLDSLLALELRNRLGACTGERQPATLLFNYPSVAALTRHFAQALLTARGEAAEAAVGNAGRIAEVTAMSEAELASLIDREFAALDKP